MGRLRPILYVPCDQGLPSTSEVDCAVCTSYSYKEISWRVVDINSMQVMAILLVIKTHLVMESMERLKLHLELKRETNVFCKASFVTAVTSRL